MSLDTISRAFGAAQHVDSNQQNNASSGEFSLDAAFYSATEFYTMWDVLCYFVEALCCCGCFGVSPYTQHSEEKENEIRFVLGTVYGGLADRSFYRGAGSVTLENYPYTISWDGNGKLSIKTDNEEVVLFRNKSEADAFVSAWEELPPQTPNAVDVERPSENRAFSQTDNPTSLAVESNSPISSILEPREQPASVPQKREATAIFLANERIPVQLPPVNNKPDTTSSSAPPPASTPSPLDEKSNSPILVQEEAPPLVLVSAPPAPETAAVDSVTIPLVAALPRTGQAAIDALQGKLTDQAKAFFGPLLQIAEVGQIDATSPLAMGDGDGSTARMVVMGLQAGKMNIDQAGLDMLATLLHDEAVCERSFVGLKAFQENAAQQARIATLDQSLTYQESEIPLIFIGDMAHDRWSCNQDIDRKIREDLHKNGAIFIRGNHDVYAHNVETYVGLAKGNQGLPFSPFVGQRLIQCGAFALDNADVDTWEEHEKLFVNAYYDKAANRLYIHNGLLLDKNNTVLTTALGEAKLRRPDPENENAKNQDTEQDSLAASFIDLKTGDVIGRPKKELVLKDKNSVETPEEFADWMNQQEMSGHDVSFTEFRPSDAEILEAAHRLDEQLSVVHGHDKDANLETPDGVININARKDNNKYATIAVRIGKTNVQVS